MAAEGLRRYSVLPIAGSILGAAGGGAAGGPTIVGIPALGIAGAAYGAAVGETEQVVLEKAVGLPTGPPVPRVLREGALGAASEFGGGLVTRGLAKAAAPFAKKVTVEGLEAMRTMGGKVLPAQATESRVLDIAQNVAEASLFGGGSVKAFKEAQDTIVEGLVNQEIAKYGGRTTGEDAGDAFVKGLTGQIQSFHQYARTLYAKVDQLAHGLQVPTADLKTWAAQELQRRSAVPALSGDTSLSILKQITQLADHIPFEEAQVIRSQALAKGRAVFGDPDRAVIRGITDQITKFTDTAMETTARAAGPAVEQAWRGANQFTRDGYAKFETDFLSGLLTEKPDAVAKALLRNNSPILIREARKAVPARAWQPVQAALATQLAEKATNVETGVISGKAMLTQLKTLGASVKEVFPTTADEVRRLARVLSTVQQAQGEGTGRMYIQLAQAGATVGIATTSYLDNPQKAAAAGLIILGPVALAKIMTSPRGIRWLTTGLTAPQGSEMAIRAASNLATFLAAGPADDQGPPVPNTVRTSTVQPPPAPR